MKLIQLTQGQFAMVDDDMYEELNQYNWYASWDRNCFRVLRNVTINGKRATVKLHRAIMNAQKGQIVDHIDNNTLNNQRSNLRLCTTSQNNMNRGMQTTNTTGYKGVFRNGKGFIAKICLNGKVIHLGTRPTAEEAHELYKEGSKQHHGDFGRVA